MLGGGTALYGVGRRFVRAHPVAGPGLVGWIDAARRSWTGGRRFRIGPHAKPNFPWIVLDRALLHYDHVARLTHARRGTSAAGNGEARAGLVAELARPERRDLEAVFARLRRHPDDPPRELRDRVERAVARILRRIDPLPGEDREPDDAERDGRAPVT
jgi:hypothetical protein